MNIKQAGNDERAIDRIRWSRRVKEDNRRRAGRQVNPIKKKKKKMNEIDGLLLLYVSATSHQHHILQTTRDRSAIIVD